MLLFRKINGFKKITHSGAAAYASLIKSTNKNRFMLGIFENHQNLYSWIPKIEKTTFDVSVVHFLLMFGYKLFSLYYPLFLLSIGLSVVKIGGVYLLIYGTIAAASLIVNFYLKKFRPALIASLGILGYGVYALIMLSVGIVGNLSLPIFYLAQIILGFSAAAWLVSLKLILMKSETKNYSQTFGWFYSAPYYASAIAPAVGGVILWKFGFTGVFLLSVIIQFVNAVYAYFRLNNHSIFLSEGNRGGFLSSLTKRRQGKVKKFLLSRDLTSWLRRRLNSCSGKSLSGDLSQPRGAAAAAVKKVLGVLKFDKTILVVLIALFAALILGGVYRAFFVLFLKDLSYSQNDIIKFISFVSIIYLPLSLLVIKAMKRLKTVRVISGGIIVEGIVAVTLGIFAGVLNLLAIFLVMLIDSLGSLAVGSGKSSWLAMKLKNHREEAATFDTIITTLGPALGGLLGGIVIAWIGYQNTFLAGGMIVFLIGIISWFCRMDNK